MPFDSVLRRAMSFYISFLCYLPFVQLLVLSKISQSLRVSHFYVTDIILLSRRNIRRTFSGYACAMTQFSLTF